MSHIVPMLNDCGQLAYIWIIFDIMELKEDLHFCAIEVQQCHVSQVNMWCDIMDNIVLELDWKYRCLWTLLENVDLLSLWRTLDFLY